MEENDCRLTADRVEDGPITRLGLSPRAFNTLNMNGIRMIGALAAMSMQELSDLKYSTATIAREIMLAVTEYRHDPKYQIPRTETDAAPADPSCEKAVPIEALTLSARSYNGLKRVGLDTVQALAGKTVEELLEIRNLGAKSAEEIAEAVQRFLASSGGEEDREGAGLSAVQHFQPVPGGEEDRENAAPAAKSSRDDRPIEELYLSVRSHNALKNAGILTVQQLLDLKREELNAIRNLGAKSLAELEALRESYRGKAAAAKTEYTAEELKPLIMSAYEQPFRGLSWQEFRDAMPEAAGDEEIRRAVGELLADGKLEYVDFRCYRVYPSFYSYLDQYLPGLESKDREILGHRYAGETMESIGQSTGVSKQRVQQRFMMLTRKLFAAYRAETGLPVFEEDFYEALYTRCELPDAFWSEELALPERSINYLKYSYTRGKTKPEEVLRDEAIPVSLRYRVRSFLDRDKIRIDGRLFAKNRADIEDYAMRKYAQDEIAFERFTELYNGMLEDNGIPFDDKIYYTESIARTRVNRLSESRHCLWKQGARLRWYDIDARDYTELLEKLNLDSYQNTDVSTRKFMLEYPDLMEAYDIRDPYELHNLLRKIKDRCGLGGINFTRQPILQFGEFDRLEMIKETVFALSPISQQDLLEYLYLEYGYDKQTMAGYLTPLSAWCHNGVYSVNFKQIPDERAALLRAKLTEDFYYLDELRRLYKKLFPEADPEELNPYSLKLLGFVVNSNYAVQHYPSAGAYFTYLLTKDEVFDLSPLRRRYGSIVMFTQTFYDLQKAHRLFLFEKDRILSARRLERLNVTEAMIEDYCAAVRAFAEPDSYFTICSLRQDGFSHELDMLGLGDYFYASLLSNDERFSYCRIFNELVLYNGSQAQFTKNDFLLAQLREYESVEPEDFMQDMQDRFGLTVPDRWEVTGAVKDSEFYYNEIMDKVYRDKALYYDDIEA